MKRFLITMTLLLVGLVVGVVNLCFLSDPSPVLAAGGMTSSLTGFGLSVHHSIREKKRKAIAKQEREHAAAVAESYRLEDGLELGLGKDWAAEVTIDKINKELGLEEPEPVEEEPEYSRGGHIQAGGITAEQVRVEPDCVQVCNGDGDVVAEHHDPNATAEEVLFLTLKQRIEAMDNTINDLNKQVRLANETRPFWGIP